MPPDESRDRTPDLYELLLTAEVQELLDRLESLEPEIARLHPAEAPNRIAFHLGRVIERSLSALPEAQPHAEDLGRGHERLQGHGLVLRGEHAVELGTARLQLPRTSSQVAPP